MTGADGMPIRIRAAGLGDASSLAALSMEVWLATYIRHGVNAFFADYALDRFTAAKFSAILSGSGEHVLVSDNAEGIDGFLRLSAGQEAGVAGCSPVEIASLYVQPRHQGRGIGAHLLAAALKRCRAQGVDRPWLAVNSENTGAIGFYERQGFRRVGQTHFRIREARYLNEIMAIDL